MRKLALVHIFARSASPQALSALLCILGGALLSLQAWVNAVGPTA